MVDGHEIEVLFVAGFGPIVRDPDASVAFYDGSLGLPLAAMPQEPTYYHGEGIDGVRHFALWPLALAARSCFGVDVWPREVPVPQAWLEFDVADVAAATESLRQRGHQLLVECRTEPWGQTVTRMLSPEGVLVSVTFTPWMR